eukprot:3787873-Rhodomonas_salina.2
MECALVDLGCGLGAGSGEVVWFQRKVMFNKERFALSKIGSKKTSDYILLREIETVRKIQVDKPRDQSTKRGSTAAPAQSQGPIASPMRRRSISATSLMDGEGDDSKVAFEIHTSTEGRNLGTVYCFRAENDVVCQDWVDCLNKAVAYSKRRGIREGTTFNERCKAKLLS